MVIQNKSEYYILELSSFQLEDIIEFKPDISILLNIDKDHLDRYCNHSAYVNAKMNIQINQNAEDSKITTRRNAHPDTDMPLRMHATCLMMFG